MITIRLSNNQFSGPLVGPIAPNVVVRVRPHRPCCSEIQLDDAASSTMGRLLKLRVFLLSQTLPMHWNAVLTNVWVQSLLLHACNAHLHPCDLAYTTCVQLSLCALRRRQTYTTTGWHLYQLSSCFLPFTCSHPGLTLYNAVCTCQSCIFS